VISDVSDWFDNLPIKKGRVNLLCNNYLILVRPIASGILFITLNGVLFKTTYASFSENYWHGIKAMGETAMGLSVRRLDPPRGGFCGLDVAWAVWRYLSLHLSATAMTHDQSVISCCHYVTFSLLAQPLI
jgi:hypothetical protein